MGLRPRVYSGWRAERAFTRGGLTLTPAACEISVMRVRVRLFASLREAAGWPETSLELPDGATAEAAWLALVADSPSLAPSRPSLAVAVNRVYASFEAVLQDADEVALIPPVSGG